jgi:DNA adenine methylase
MRYCGSKQPRNKWVRDILNIINTNIRNEQTYIEPFLGGANMFSNVNHNKKIGSDDNHYLMDMWIGIQNGTFIPPFKLSEEEYQLLEKSWLNNDGLYPNSLIGYVANACSYGSSWFNGYSGINTKTRYEDHIKEAANGLIKQVNKFINLDTCIFKCSSYDELNYPSNSFIYCDPPYQNTKKYKYSKPFDHVKFWNWVRYMVNNGHIILISEYQAPNDFDIIYQKSRKCGMKNFKIGDKQEEKIEKLFIHNLQRNLINL